MMNKPLAIAYKPFRAMNMKANTSKERNFYTQGQRFAARILFILWLLASSSPEGILAVPQRGEAIVPVASPNTLSLSPDNRPAMDYALQQLTSQRDAPFRGRDLLGTSPDVSPVEGNLSFQARGGESVRFHYQMGQWHAEVSSHIGAFSRQSVLPVVCSQGTDVTSSLEVLSKYPSWQRQRQIHVLDRNVCPTLGEVIYVGELGLKGGGEGANLEQAQDLMRLGNVRHDLGDTRQAVSFYEQALTKLEQVYKEEPNHSEIASTLNNLGNARLALGDACQAVSFCQRVLTIYEQVYQETPNHPHIASTLNNLGIAWGALGDARQAVSFCQRALVIYEQVYQKTPNHPHIASILNNLGNASRDLGDARQAVSFYERALAIYEQVYQETPNHPHIASILNNLGNAWDDLGDARQAVSFYERALAMKEQIYQETPNHPEIASTLNNLGTAWSTLSDARQAVSFYQRALAIYEQVYQETPNHPHIAMTLNNLGNAWRALGDARQAVSYYDRALAIYEQSYQETPNHPHIAMTLNNLGNAWRALGDALQAVSFYEPALAMKEQVYQETPNHPDIASTLNNLGNAWRALGDASKAASYYERALKIFEQVYQETPDHPDIAMTLNNLGTAWSDLDDACKAASYYKRALAIYQQVYQETPNHPDIAMTLNNLGAAWSDLDDASKAASYYERALAIYKQVYQETPNHPDIAMTLNNLGNAWRDLEDGRKAVSFYQRALAIYQQVYQETPNHPEIARTLNNLGTAWSILGDARKAKRYYQRALKMKEKIYGPNHPEISKALYNFANTCRDPDTKCTSLERVLAIAKEVHKDNLNHPEVAKALYDLALAWEEDRRQEICAVCLLEGALAIYEQVYQATPNDPHIVSTQNALNRVSDTLEELQIRSLPHQFIEACSKGNNSSAAQLPISCLPKDLKDSIGNPLICWMARHAMILTLTRVLIVGKWDPNLPDIQQWYPIHYGAMNNVAVTRLLLQAGAHPFAQTAQGDTPAMVARSNSKMETLQLLLPEQAGLSFEDLTTFEESYRAYKEYFPLSAAGDEALLVALECALHLGDPALLQAISTSKAQGLLSQLAQKYQLGEDDAIQSCFNALLSAPNS